MDSEKKAFLTFVSTEIDCFDEKFDLTTEFRSLKCWGSLTALLLISALNEKTDLIIHSKQLVEWKTFNDMFMFIHTNWHGSFSN